MGACAGEELGASLTSTACQAFLDVNKRAALQWKLEGQLAAFEDSIVTK